MRALILRFLRFFPARWWKPSAWKAWGSYLHWRLETYGVYYPDHPLNGKAVLALLRQTPSYLRWIGDFDRIRAAKAYPIGRVARMDRD